MGWTGCLWAVRVVSWRPAPFLERDVASGRGQLLPRLQQGDEAGGDDLVPSADRDDPARELTPPREVVAVARAKSDCSACGGMSTVAPWARSSSMTLVICMPVFTSCAP